MAHLGIGRRRRCQQAGAGYRIRFGPRAEPHPGRRFTDWFQSDKRHRPVGERLFFGPIGEQPNHGGQLCVRCRGLFDYASFGRHLAVDCPGGGYRPRLWNPVYSHRPLAGDCFGMAHFGAIFGLIFTAYGFLAGPLGPWPSGYIVDSTQGHYTIVFSHLGFMYLASAGIILLVRPWR